MNTATFASKQVAWSEMIHHSNMNTIVSNFLGRENAMLFSHCLAYYMPSITERYGVERITDGMGNTTIFEFEYLIPENRANSTSIYKMTTSGVNHDRHIHAIGLPVKAVKSIHSINGGVSECKAYRYENLLVHRHGKGLLGFASTECQNFLNGELQNIVKSFSSTETMGEHCGCQ